MNIKDKFKLLQWTEAIIWIIIISLVIFGIRYHSYKEKKEYMTYQIFLQDVDGLIVGSPVRMMGVPVGYIEKIKIIGDTVYVKFIMTEKETTLPKGAIATVEFNGLGGSKSLEIYPPTAQSLATNKLIVIHAPMRLHDSLGLLNDMFDKLNSMILKGVHFTNEMEEYIPKKDDFQLDDNQKSLQNFDNFLDELQQNRLEFNKKIKGFKHE